MINVGGRHQYQGGTIQDRKNDCTKYGFNNLIISGDYCGHRRHMMDNGRRTTDAGQRHGYGISSPQVS